MSKSQLPQAPPTRDQLITRPDEAPLPTPLGPAGPQARGAPADPKPDPQASPGLPGKPGADDLGQTV